MYRGRLWTMRQFAGFGTARDTNRALSILLAEEQDRALDGLTCRLSWVTTQTIRGPRGKWGAREYAVSSLVDMRRLFEEILWIGYDIDDRHCTASIMFAMYLAVAEERGNLLGPPRSTIPERPMLKEFIAQKEWICPPRTVHANRCRHDRIRGA